MSAAEFVVVDGLTPNLRYDIPEDVNWILGRDRSCEVELPVDNVSREHLRIENRPDGVYITDLQSSNGTYVNGKPVASAVLNHGDTIELGDAVLRFRQDKAPVIAPTRTGAPSSAINLPPSTESGVAIVEDEGASPGSIRKKYTSGTYASSSDLEEQVELVNVRRRLDAVSTMADTVNSTTELDEILATAADTILHVTHASRAAILLKDDDDAEAVPVAVRTDRPDPTSSPLNVSRTIVNESINEGVSILSSDAMEDERFKMGQSIVMQQIRSVMCVPLRTKEKNIGALYADQQSLEETFSEPDLETLAVIGHQAGVAIERARLIQDLENLFIGAMHAIVASIEAKDSYTRGHSERVTAYGLMISDELGLESDQREIIELGGILHDVGKIGVREAVLQKPDKLTDEEFDEIKRHPTVGAEIVKTMRGLDRIVSMKDILDVVLHHHEQVCGKGYPDGLGGDEIPFNARILAVADTFDAITSDRPYRKGREGGQAMEIIQKVKGSQLDPVAVDAFQSVFDKGLTDGSQNFRSQFQLLRWGESDITPSDATPPDATPPDA